MISAPEEETVAVVAPVMVQVIVWSGPVAAEGKNSQRGLIA
jgi:hypothetical protein